MVGQLMSIRLVVFMTRMTTEAALSLFSLKDQGLIGFMGILGYWVLAHVPIP